MRFRVLLIAAIATALYTVLGFLIAIFGLLFALLVIVERKPVLAAVAYSLVVTGLAYGLFKAIKTPLPIAPAGDLDAMDRRPSHLAARLFGRAAAGSSGTRSSAAWSARWSACCPASGRSPASASCCR